MTTTIRTFTKAPSDILDYTINFAGALNSGTIDGATWTVSPVGPTLSGASTTAGSATTMMAGGSLGVTYTLTCTATTSGGLSIARSIAVVIASL